MAAVSVIAIVPTMTKVKFDPIKDFAPISNIATNPFVLVVNKDLPVKTLAEFVAYVKAQKGKLSYASAGRGSLTHLSMALFLKQAGIDMIHVPYKGNAPALGRRDRRPCPGDVLQPVRRAAAGRSGNVRLLAVSGEKRVVADARCADGRRIRLSEIQGADLERADGAGRNAEGDRRQGRAGDRRQPPRIRNSSNSSPTTASIRSATRRRSSPR